MEKKQNEKTGRGQLRQHLDRRLRFRFRIYFLIAFVMVCFDFYDILTVKISVILSLLGIIVGIGVGVISSRMYHISWDHDANKVVSQLDFFGGIILVLYILFEISRGWIVSFFLRGPEIGAVSFAILSGTMIGRVVGTRGKILKILNEQKLLG